MIIVGLGNPGEKYSLTRHNVGFIVVDNLCNSLGLEWKKKSSWNASLAEGRLGSHVVKLLKPTTFMNLSGNGVVPALRFWNWQSHQVSITKETLGTKEVPEKLKSSLVVVHDELAFPAGIAQLKFSGSAGGHNGLKDIIEKLGTQDFYRLRVGIGHPRDSANPRIEVSDWVLGRPNPEESNAISISVDKAVGSLEALITQGEIQAREALNTLN